MADNVLLPATGTGTASVTQATDDVAGVHYPLVKLVDGTADSTAVIPGSATDGLLVNLGTNNDVTVTGSVTANAGTNLNTSTLAKETGGNLDVIKTNTDTLTVVDAGGYVRQDSNATIAKETGGNLAGAATSLAIIDDWDETDRAKVNPIAGQAGVQGGAGAVTALTQRVAIATDANAVTEASGSAIKTAVELIDDAIKSDDATFTVATDKVMMQGRQAVAHGSNPDAADAGDAVAGIANRHRVPFMIGGHPNIVTVSTSYTSTQADVAIISASAGTKIVVTSIGIYADGGGTGPLDVQVGFGTATIDTAKAIIDHPGIVKGSGVVLGNGAGIIAVGADAEDLRIDATGFGTGDELTVCVSYYTIES